MSGKISRGFDDAKREEQGGVKRTLPQGFILASLEKTFREVAIGSVQTAHLANSIQ